MRIGFKEVSYCCNDCGVDLLRGIAIPLKQLFIGIGLRYYRDLLDTYHKKLFRSYAFIFLEFNGVISKIDIEVALVASIKEIT